MTARIAPRPAGLDWWGLGLLAFAALYLLTWWNRYLAPTNGFDLTFAAEFGLRGHMPYRDFYFPLPPGWFLMAVAGVRLFGPHLIGFWLVGLLLRLAAVGCLYGWLTRLAPRPWAALATLTAFVVACSDVADYPAFYNHVALLFALLAGYAVVRSLEATELRGLIWATVAGLCLAGDFLTKQTTGVLAGAATLLAAAVAVGRWHGKRCVRTLLVMVLAGAVPCALVAAWLIHEGAWSAFLDQVFLSGPSSKGGLGGSFARLAKITVGNPELLGAWLLGLTAAAVLVVVGTATIGEGPRRRRVLSALVLAAALGAAYLVALWSGSATTTTRGVTLAAAAMGTLACCGAALRALWAVLRGARDPFTLHLGLLGAVGFAGALALALSWPLFEPMVWPGLALALALAFRGARPRVIAFRAVLMAVCVFLIGWGGWRKYEYPHTWGHWYEPPVAEAAREPEAPALKGFCLSPGTARFFDDVTDLVQTHSRPGDPILVFPHMPVFYALADRPLSTFSYMHWIDVCPDAVADRDAQTLAAAPPAVIVLMDFGPDGLRTDESSFRSGQESGQKRLLATVHGLLADYEQVGDFPVPQQERVGDRVLSVQVWARRSAAAQAAGPQTNPSRARSAAQ